MRPKLAVLRTKVGLAVIGGALLLTGVGIGTNAAIGSPGTDQVSDSITVETPAPESPAAPTTSESPAPEPAPAATVDEVSPDPQLPAAEPAPQESTNDGIGTVGPDGNYTPAPPLVGPGEPPVAPPPPAPPIAPVPGEDGYIPPQG